MCLLSGAIVLGSHQQTNWIRLWHSSFSWLERGETESQPAVLFVVFHWLSTVQGQACFNYNYTRINGRTEGMRTMDLNGGWRVISSSRTTIMCTSLHICLQQALLITEWLIWVKCCWKTWFVVCSQRGWRSWWLMSLYIKAMVALQYMTQYERQLCMYGKIKLWTFPMFFLMLLATCSDSVTIWQWCICRGPGRGFKVLPVQCCVYLLHSSIR